MNIDYLEQAYATLIKYGARPSSKTKERPTGFISVGLGGRLVVLKGGGIKKRFFRSLRHAMRICGKDGAIIISSKQLRIIRSVG